MSGICWAGMGNWCGVVWGNGFRGLFCDVTLIFTGNIYWLFSALGLGGPAAVAALSLSVLCAFHALRAYCENHKALKERDRKGSNGVALDF